jgi:small subunit ribosomal protein S17
MQRILQGEVVSTMSDKTIAVAIKTRKQHPLYKKLYSSTKKFLAHDENSIANKGDIVEIVECRPLSKRKRWNLLKVVEKAHIRHVEEEDIEESKK